MNAKLWTIFLVVFIDLLGFGIVIPILPYYAESFGAGGQELGFLMLAYSGMQFLMAPVWGKFSDKWGRRPILLMSILGTALALFFLSRAETLTQLYLGRLAAGFFGANLSTAYAYISDITTEENRAKGMGIIGAGFGLGFIFGPAVGGLLSPFGYGAPMLAGAVLAAFNLVVAYFVISEPPIDEETRRRRRARKLDVPTLKLAFSRPKTQAGISAFFLFTLAVVQMEVAFALFLKGKFGLDAKAAGMLLGFNGICMVLMQGGAVGRLAKRFGETSLIAAGALFCGLGLAIFALSPVFWGMVFGLGVLAIGHGIAHPSLSSLTSKGAAPEDRGLVMGVFQSAGSLSRVIGPVLAGAAFDHISPQTPFFVGTIFLFFVWVLIKIRRHKLI